MLGRDFIVVVPPKMGARFLCRQTFTFCKYSKICLWPAGADSARLRGVPVFETKHIDVVVVVGSSEPGSFSVTPVDFFTL